jgi:glutamine synthetase
VLRRQVDALAAMGMQAMIGSEIELYLYRESYEEALAADYRDLHPHSAWVQDYHVLQTTRDEYVIGDIRRGLEAAGVPVEFSKGEAGRGQHEINLTYAAPVEMADRNTVYKTAAKEIAAAHGRSVTFMAKPVFDDAGSSCHIHSSLRDLAGAPLFAGAGDGGDNGHGGHAALPQVFRHWIAGLVATAREFALLWAPTVNSYKRFQPGSWAPTSVAWGVDNRTLGFRVVGHGASARVESRLPGADANCYLAFAATLAGGMYGVRNRLDPGPPYEGDGYAAADLVRVPTTLAEAIELWEGSDLARACFGDAVHRHIATTARAEWSAFQRTVTDWERRRYWERI